MIDMTKNLKLLIIDDDKIDLMNIVRLLKQSDWPIDIEEASNSEVGLALAQTKAYDLILLDYQMPLINGLEILKKLRESSTNTANIVMLSHSNDIEISMQCIEAGAQDFITKKEISVTRLSRAIIHSQERFRIEVELRESNERLQQLSEKDALTGLANRYLFDSSFEKAISYSRRENKNLALFLVDLDKFKEINDSLGHDFGDELLKEVAKRLNATIREEDIACRIGGDEFVILMQNLEHITTAKIFSKRILSSLNVPFEYKGKTVNILSSIGIATFPNCGETAKELFKSADIAMYRSKEEGGNQSCFYSRQVHKEIQYRMDLEEDLKEAITKNQFFIHYQAQVNPQDHSLVGVEALIRWQHPKYGLLLPEDFIYIAEEIGMISQIDLWTFDTICSVRAKWINDFGSSNINFPMSVNFSAMHFYSAEISHEINNILAKYELPDNFIELECKEHPFGSKESELLQSLSQLNLNITLDHFGTGNASLLYIQQHPITVIKLDKSLIQNISGLRGNIKFIKAMCEFSKAMEISIVASGIETDTQYALCKELSFDRLQGNSICVPMLADKFEQHWLK